MLSKSWVSNSPLGVHRDHAFHVTPLKEHGLDVVPVLPSGTAGPNNRDGPGKEGELTLHLLGPVLKVFESFFGGFANRGLPSRVDLVRGAPPLVPVRADLRGESLRVGYPLGDVEGPFLGGGILGKIQPNREVVGDKPRLEGPRLRAIPSKESGKLVLGGVARDYRYISGGGDDQ